MNPDGYISDDAESRARANGPVPCRVCTYFSAKPSLFDPRQFQSRCGRLSTERLVQPTLEIMVAELESVVNQLAFDLARATGKCSFFAPLFSPHQVCDTGPR